MHIAPNGTFVFDDICDLYYELFNEIGLAVRNDYLYDQDSSTPIQFDGKFIKVSLDGHPVYAGKNEVLFEPQNNYHLTNNLFGFYLDRCTRVEDPEDEPILRDYISHYIDDDETKEKQQVVVKTSDRVIPSGFYYQIYLAFFDCIFRIGGYNVDLSNFDFKVIKEKKK